MTTKREDIYDTQINPLMAQIIAICKEHDIPAVASFQLDDVREEESEFKCTTSLLFEGAGPSMRAAHQALTTPRRPAWAAFTIISAPKAEP